MQQFQAKGGIKTPHIVVGDDGTPALTFVSSQPDFIIKNTAIDGVQTLDIGAKSTDSTKQLFFRPFTSPGNSVAINGDCVAVLLHRMMRVLYSTDAGNTFTEITCAPAKVYTGIVFYKGKYFVSSNEDVQSTTDFVTWTTVVFPVVVDPLWAISMSIANDTLIIACDNNYIHYSTDGVTFLSSQVAPISSRINFYKVIYDGTRYTGTGDNVNPKAQYSSTDLVTWQLDAYQPDPNSILYSVSMAYTPSNRTYWALNQDETLWKCTSMGFWTRVLDIPDTEDKEAQLSALYSFEDTVLVGLSTGELYYTLDAGKTWAHKQVATRNIWCIAKAHNKFIVTTDSEIYETTFSNMDTSILQITNDGVSTSKIQSNIPNALTRKDYVDAKILTELKIESDRLDAKDIAIEASIADLASTSFDYGEY